MCIRDRFVSILLVVFSKSSLDRVPFVANTPIFLFFDFFKAGLIPGSIPTKGIWNFFLSKLIALVVAVLQATTINLHPLSISQLEFFKLIFWISEIDFEPYGEFFESA